MTETNSDVLLHQYRTLADTQQEVIIEQRGRILTLEKRIAELEKERRWRLPPEKPPECEEEERYLVTWINGQVTPLNWGKQTVTIGDVDVTQWGWIDDFGGYDFEWDVPDAIIAWRPMPAPYQEGA